MTPPSSRMSGDTTTSRSSAATIRGGGEHSGAQRLDRRLAFSEGWSNAWSGIALQRGTYTDSLGTQQARGVLIDLSAGPTDNPGWFREPSIQSILWNLDQHVGFQPIHAAMTSGVKNAVAMTSIHSFAAALTSRRPAALAPWLRCLVNMASAAHPMIHSAAPRPMEAGPDHRYCAANVQPCDRRNPWRAFPIRR